MSQLLISFIRFQENRFDKNATAPATTRLPMRCFHDFKPGGALCHIFAIMYRYKAQKHLEKLEFDLTEPSCKENDSKIELSIEVYARFIDVMCIRLPVAYIRPEVDDEQMSKILKDRQGEITKKEEEATHIIYPKTEAGEDYARPSFKRGKDVMIHWYRTPESHDLWVANTFNLPVNIKLLFKKL